MEVRIGVSETQKEIEVDLGDDADSEAVSKQITDALSESEGMLWLTDRKGRKIGVPSAKVAYVEIESSHEARRVGFGTGIR